MEFFEIKFDDSYVALDGKEYPDGHGGIVQEPCVQKPDTTGMPRPSTNGRSQALRRIR